MAKYYHNTYSYIKKKESMIFLIYRIVCKFAIALISISSLKTGRYNNICKSYVHDLKDIIGFIQVPYLYM